MSGPRTFEDRATRIDLVALGALAAGLLAWYVGLFVVRGFAYPVGPDGPVYLWWTRLAGHDGLSAVSRPGVPAIALVLQGTLHLPLTAVLSAIECVLGAAVGLGAAALVRQPSGGAVRSPAGQSEPWATWVVAGMLAGTFAVHLAAGYLANLAFAARSITALGSTPTARNPERVSSARSCPVPQPTSRIGAAGRRNLCAAAT